MIIPTNPDPTTAVLRADTRILAVIGHPVLHSVSPQMHNAAIQRLGLNLCYVAFHVLPQQVGAAIGGMRALDILGLNVTVPHKQAVIPFLDEVSGEARRVGAVNTIANRDGKLWGYNTDVAGVMRALRETAGLSMLPPRAAVMGASGAARAVAYGLAGATEVEELLIFNRTALRAEHLAQEVQALTGKQTRGLSLERRALAAELPACGLVVNATSVGMHPDEAGTPLPDVTALSPAAVVYDIVFNPRESRLVQEARARGCRAFGGIDMLIFQGAAAFEIWTGVAPPIDVMRAAVGAGTSPDAEPVPPG